MNARGRSRQTSQRKGRLADRATQQEERVISAVDKRKEFEDIFSQLTEEEQQAFAIAIGVERPEGSKTRAWAARVMKSISEARCLGLVTKYVMKTNEMEAGILKVMEYTVAKPKVTVEQSGPEGSPISVAMQLVDVPPTPKNYQEWLSMRDVVRKDADRSIDEKIKDLESKLAPACGDSLKPSGETDG